MYVHVYTVNYTSMYVCEYTHTYGRVLKINILHLHLKVQMNSHYYFPLYYNLEV